MTERQFPKDSSVCSRFPLGAMEEGDIYDFEDVVQRISEHHIGDLDDVAEIIAGKLGSALPKCADSCRMSVTVEGLSTGMVGQYVLVLACVSADNLTCEPHHDHAAGAFVTWSGELLERAVKVGSQATSAETYALHSRGADQRAAAATYVASASSELDEIF